MRIIRKASDLSRIANPAIRKLVTLRLHQLHSPDDLDNEPVELIVVEEGDAVSEIEQTVGFPILTGLFDDLPYTDPAFQPCSDLLEQFTYDNTCIYEMVFSCGSDGAVACFIPDESGVDADLLAMCHAFATTAVSTP